DVLEQGGEVELVEVALHKLETVRLLQPLDVLALALRVVVVGEAVDSHHLRPAGKQGLGQVRADEPRRAGEGDPAHVRTGLGPERSRATASTPDEPSIRSPSTEI